MTREHARGERQAPPAQPAAPAADLDVRAGTRAGAGARAPAESPPASGGANHEAPGGANREAPGGANREAPSGADGQADGAAHGQADAEAHGEADGQADGAAHGQADAEAHGEADAEAHGEADGEATPVAAEELDPETRARRDEALRHVRKLGDPVLRASALPVDRFDAPLRAEIERMGELMTDALGVGLAATQIGVLHRVLVYRAYPEEPITALVNPVIEWASEELEAAEEGCLSLPGVHVEVERPAQVRVRAQDAGGDELEIEAEAMTARVIQHEIDHLDGILILDRVSREARKEAMRALREAREEKARQGREPHAGETDGGQQSEASDRRAPSEPDAVAEAGGGNQAEADAVAITAPETVAQEAQARR